MNGRIKLLAEQAMNYATDRLIQTHRAGPDFVNDFREKFAELIVRECAWAADFADREPGDYILKHFGVKEIMEDRPDEIEYCPTCGEEWSGTSCGALRCGWIEGNEE